MTVAQEAHSNSKGRGRWEMLSGENLFLELPVFGLEGKMVSFSSYPFLDLRETWSLFRVTRFWT